MNRRSRYSQTRYFRRLVAGAVMGIAIVGFAATPLAAQPFSSGSTGADGAFNPTCTPTPCTVPVASPASGIFNFTTVNVPAGVTVTFSHNAANTPVTILASGDVTVAGTIDVNGQRTAIRGSPGRGGPGGFDGGMGGTPTTSLVGTSGLGPGGGGGGVLSSARAAGGGFGTKGMSIDPIKVPPGTTYGLPTLLPLIGGSGGGGAAGGAASPGEGGGGGGGAILIASSGTIAVTGTIRADGGSIGTTAVNEFGGAGSGGGIRLVANRIAGTGTISASGGGFSGFGAGTGGGAGRIRLEAVEMAFAGTVSPAPSSGIPGPVTPPAGFPTIRITSVSGVAAPDSPQGSFLAPPDITLSPTVPNPVTVNLAAANIPTGTLVTVTITPEGGARTTANSTPLAGTEASSTATASVTLPNGTSVLSATATFATSVASLGAPMMIGGEEVKWIRVGATWGGGSTVAYITASGREFVVK